MLSRAAERVYWTGRYLERAENTARLVQQYSQLLLDLPEEVGVRWSELIRVVGAAGVYDTDDSEADVLGFLLADADSPLSLTYSLRMARENMRNTRDLLPQESWETMNELYHDARSRLPLAARGDNRFEILAECIARCQQINGSLTGTMSHHSPYQFLVLGQNIERADMTSRIIDVATTYIRHNERLVRRYGSSLWTNVLKSVSGFQMYRQFCQPQVQGYRVIGFLLTDTAFPRSAACCLRVARNAVAALPQGDALGPALDNTAELLDTPPDEVRSPDEVSELMDVLQKRLGALHDAIASTWFLRDTG
jgi:uncharacterized alpha-E superfamily protein